MKGRSFGAVMVGAKMRPPSGRVKKSGSVDAERELRYADEMSTRVRLAEKAEDRPRASSLIAVGLSALCAGLATARGIAALVSHGASAPAKTHEQPLAPAPPPVAPMQPVATSRAPAPSASTTISGIEVAEAARRRARASEPPAQVAAVEPTKPSSIPTAAPMARPVEARARAIETSAPAPARAIETSAPAPARAIETNAPAPARTIETNAPARALEPVDPNAADRGPLFQMGIVAYDRCDGIAQRAGRFPCPRDLKLEQQVWQALRVLESCKLAQTQRGQGEVRYEWVEGEPLQLRVRGPKRDAVDHAIVTKCTGRALASAHSELGSNHMIVRFRFELR